MSDFKVGDIVRRTKECLQNNGLTDIDENGNDCCLFEVLEIDESDDYDLLVELVYSPTGFNDGAVMWGSSAEAELVERDGELCINE